MVQPDINEYIRSLKQSQTMGHLVAGHLEIPARSSEYSSLTPPWPDPIQTLLQTIGVDQLYCHQVEAITHVRSSRHVVTATPTASGKSLIYNLPVFENVIQNPDSRALYIFPLKALAQDQLRIFQHYSALLKPHRPTAAIYDGDTPWGQRAQIRNTPPNVLMTNPDMIHLSILPHHGQWRRFFSDLKIVVIDEVHTLRGLFGSHAAWVFRRLLRICREYGSEPTFVFSSATVANPGDLATRLTGLEVAKVTHSGAPAGKKHLILLDGMDGPVQTTIMLLKAALHRNLRTIVYTQSRKLTELIAMWATQGAGKYTSRISPYRAGFLPEERRDIERRLTNGDLLAVIATSALELGIDIGDLDLCILVGYPGTMVATWQRGGRVGRSGQDSAIILVAGDDALDQYFLRHPDEIAKRRPESAVLNPWNAKILEVQLPCAAAELPLKMTEPLMQNPDVINTVNRLTMSDVLLRHPDQPRIFASDAYPHRQVNLRGIASQFQIVDSQSGKHLGEVDAFRGYRDMHPGAVYLHQGRTYVVNVLDPDDQVIKVTRRRINYYTRVLATTDIQVLGVVDMKPAGNIQACAGKLRVRDEVVGYQKWAMRGRRNIGTFSLDMPPNIFETEGIWFFIPDDLHEKSVMRGYNFLGALHAMEHAIIGIFPLIVMADRNDLGGLSTDFHSQTGKASVFIYDGIAGGAGLSREAFQNAYQLLEQTLKAISDCPCNTGCPSCVHSPKCGSANSPMDKHGARFILELILGIHPSKPAGSIGKHPKLSPEKSLESIPDEPQPQPDPEPADASASFQVGVLALAPQRPEQTDDNETPGHGIGIHCAVLYDMDADGFYVYQNDQMASFEAHLQRLDLLVGFHLQDLDYRVLAACTDLDLNKIPALDILEPASNHLGFRPSLDSLARATLGIAKSTNGLQSSSWGRKEQLSKMIDYCKMRAEIIKNIFIHGIEKGYILVNLPKDPPVQIPVEWSSFTNEGRR